MIYLNTLNLSKERIQFEKSLKKIENWIQYLEFENNFKRKQSIFERCLIKNSKNNSIWLKYIQFLKENEKNEFLLNVRIYCLNHFFNFFLKKTLNRAIKNCPTNSIIIISYMNNLQLNSTLNVNIELKSKKKKKKFLIYIYILRII